MTLKTDIPLELHDSDYEEQDDAEEEENLNNDMTDEEEETDDEDNENDDENEGDPTGMHVDTEQRGEDESTSSKMVSVVASQENEQQLKAEALRQQIGLWDAFLELRIKLQRATITCNCLPTPDELLTKLSKNDSLSTDDKLREVMDENSRLFRKTIALLLAIENRSSSISVTNSSSSAKRSRDSESEIEEDNDDNVQRQQHKTTKNKKIKVVSTTDLFKDIDKRLKAGDEAVDEELDAAYKRFVPRRDAIVQKWYDRTRGFAKRNKSDAAAEHSPVVQIKEIMALPERLLKRTQTPRTDYDLVVPPSSPEQQTNVELFDDGDFYHQLLREFIDRKSASITDPEQISKHWAQLRKLRTKLKKNVDTTATKGKKIRFTQHKKLINYMAPTDRCSFSEDAKSDLFSSLFGGHGNVQVHEERLHRPPTTERTALNDIRII